MSGAVLRRAGGRDWARDLALLVLLLGLLFGAGLGNRALWTPDEGRYVEIPREMVESGDYVTPRLNGVKYFEKPPLFYWLEAGAIKTFGLNEWSARLWPALFALFGCLGVYVAGRRLYDRRTGLIAAAILATSPLYYALGRVVILDMAVSVLLSLAMLAFLVGLREPLGLARRLWLWAFYALAALATLSKGLIGMVIPAMIIGTWIIVLWDWRLLLRIYLPSGLFVFLAVAAPWHVLAAQANPEFARFYFIHEHFERYLTTAHERFKPLWYFVPVLVGGFFPWIVFATQGLAASARGFWRDRQARREELFLVLWAVLIFAFFSLSSSKLAPYILPILPPLALLVAKHLSSRWEEERSTGWNAAFFVIFVTGIVLAGLLLFAGRDGAEPSRVADAVDELGLVFYFVVATLGVLGLVPWIAYRYRGAAAGIAAAVVAAALFLNAVVLALPGLDERRSVKSLALAVKVRLQPGDEVIVYRTYPQDLPVYLERRVTIAEWREELTFGMGVEDTSAWMIDEAEFQRRWRSPGRVYLFILREDFDPLQARWKDCFHLIGQVGDNVLATNKENAP